MDHKGCQQEPGLQSPRMQKISGLLQDWPIHYPCKCEQIIHSTENRPCCFCVCLPGCFPTITRIESWRSLSHGDMSLNFLGSTQEISTMGKNLVSANSSLGISLFLLDVHPNLASGWLSYKKTQSNSVFCLREPGWSMAYVHHQSAMLQAASEEPPQRGSWTGNRPAVQRRARNKSQGPKRSIDEVTDSHHPSMDNLWIIYG